MLLINAVNAEGRPVELYVKDGKIAAVGQDLAALAGENETVLDAGGLTVLPAFVDLHCHWRTPGFEYKEDIETGSRAAAAGGYTFVNLMPNTKPVCSSAAQAAMVEQKAAEVGLCGVNQTVSITEDFDGKTIDHLKTLPASVKFITEDGHGVQDNATMARAFAICTQRDITVMSHAEDMEIEPLGLSAGRGHRDGAELLAERVLPDPPAHVPRLHPGRHRGHPDGKAAGRTCHLRGDAPPPVVHQ